jgi:hypothetical protein
MIMNLKKYNELNPSDELLTAVKEAREDYRKGNFRKFENVDRLVDYLRKK